MSWYLASAASRRLKEAIGFFGVESFFFWPRFAGTDTAAEALRRLATTDLTLSRDEVLLGREFAEAHGAEGVELGRGDADFGA